MHLSPTSSSLVLRNRDLLDIIFGFCKFHKPQELLQASLTSKTFLEPALNALWHDVDNVLQLCYPLPTFNKKTYVSQDNLWGNPPSEDKALLGL